MQGQTYNPANRPGARTNTMNPDLGGAVVTGFGIATGVGLFLLAVYGLAYATRRI